MNIMLKRSGEDCTQGQLLTEVESIHFLGLKSERVFDYLHAGVKYIAIVVTEPFYTRTDSRGVVTVRPGVK